MNPNYEILEQLLRLDADAGAATVDWRNAQKQLFELAKKTKLCEDTIAKTKVEMAYLEGELRRQFRKIDELEERKSDKAAKLFAAKNDDEHRGFKREVDNVDRELKDFTRRTEPSSQPVRFDRFRIKRDCRRGTRWREDYGRHGNGAGHHAWRDLDRTLNQ